MKKTLPWIVGISMIVALTGCGKNEVKDLSKVELTDIAEANEGYQLLENHDSVSYKMEIREEGSKINEEAVIWKDGGDVRYQVQASQGESERTEVYKDGFIYCEVSDEDGDDKTHEVWWCMDGEYDKTLKECVSAFLVETTEGLAITEREDGKDYYSVTAQVDEGDNKSEEYDFFYEYVMDKSSLGINQFVAYALDKNQKKNVMSFAQVAYDEEYKEPSYVKGLEKPKKTRTVTLIQKDSKGQEKKTEEKVAADAIFGVVAPSGYGIFKDADGKNAYDEYGEKTDADGNYSDITLYLLEQ